MPTPSKNTLLRSALFIAFGACLLTTCRKEEPEDPTIFNITVVDSKSGKPVPGAVAFLKTVDTKLNDWASLKTETFFGDSLGQFTMTIPGDRSMSSFFLTAPGYLTRINFVKAQRHQSNDLEIPLIPTDAILKLTIENKTGLTNQFYMAATSPTVLKELGRNYALYDPKVEPGKQASYIWRFPSGEYASLYFDTTNFIRPIKFNLADIQDSVFLKPNDTTFYRVAF